jgi:hypothetical protein
MQCYVWKYSRKVKIKVARWYIYLHTKNPNLGIHKYICWKALKLNMLGYVFCGHLSHFTAIWYICM